MPVERAVASFGKRFRSDQIVVDLGCGNKPYADYFQAKYIGIDPFPGTKADIIANAWETGLADASVDAVIMNQSLEHIPETEKTVRETWRILKPGGLVLVTVPQTVRNHGIPLKPAEAPIHDLDPAILPYWNVDYWRFTKYGLRKCLEQAGFAILDLHPCGGVYALLGQVFLDHRSAQGKTKGLVSKAISRLALWLDMRAMDVDDTLGWMCIAEKRSMGAG